jgi:hypothetical protein
MRNIWFLLGWDVTDGCICLGAARIPAHPT